jgi:hypothetical protein
MRSTTAVDALLDRVTFDVALVMADLERLAGALAAGQGDEYPHELTPEQADRLGDDLAAIGVEGGLILAADLARTAERGGAEVEAAIEEAFGESWIGPEQLPD